MKICFGDNSRSPAEFRDVTWEYFVNVLQIAQRIKRNPDKNTKIFHTPWFSPMILKPGEIRKYVVNVSHMSNFMTFDVDTHGWTKDRFQRVLKDLTYVIYTTTLSVPESQRWRIVISASREMTTTEYVTVWYWCNECLFDSEVDPKTKNVNRLSYMPAHWTGADNLFFNQISTDLNIDMILQQAVKQQVPQVPVQVALLTGKTGKSIITPNMEANYRAKSKGGRLYDMMCSAAKRHKINGWALTSSDLAAAALAVSRSVEPTLARPNIDGEAAKAIGWADTNIETLSEMDKLRSRLLWATRK